MNEWFFGGIGFAVLGLIGVLMGGLLDRSGASVWRQVGVEFSSGFRAKNRRVIRLFGVGYLCLAVVFVVVGVLA